jgi:hypothetical protein
MSYPGSGYPPYYPNYPAPTPTHPPAQQLPAPPTAHGSPQLPAHPHAPGGTGAPPQVAPLGTGPGFTTTTLAGPVAITSTTIVVTSATGLVSNKLLRIDDEMLQIQQGYTGTTTVPVLRGRDGTPTQTHPVGANVIAGFATDFALLPAPGMSDSVLLPGGTPNIVTSYGASGAITLPTAVGLNVIILNGTTALTMTLAAPTTDMDGVMAWVVGNGKAAHVLQVAGTAGLGNAGAGYRNATFAAGAQNSLLFCACNGQWVPLSVYGGTATAITVTLS